MLTSGLRALAVAAAMWPASMPAKGQEMPTRAGAYLAARSAAMAHDFGAASDWYLTALGNDPKNPVIMENALAALLALGDIERAVPVAERLVTLGSGSQLAHMTLQQDAAIRGDWPAIFDMLEAGQAVGPLVDGLTRAWARIGLGQMDQALSAFDEVIETPGLRGFGLYHKAIALASVGDFESAAEIMSAAPADGLVNSHRALIARAQILSQLGQTKDAIALLRSESAAGLNDPTLDDILARLEAGKTLPFDFVSGAREGLAEVYFTVAGALLSEAPESYVLLYARVAQTLAPNHVEATLLIAELMDELGRYDLAEKAFSQIPQSHPAYPMAELGRADELRKLGQTDKAITLCEELSKSEPDMAAVQVTLGDMRRIEGKDAEAEVAYTRAIEIMKGKASWWLHYARGITRHRLDNWSGAEADFRAALADSPQQSQVLNFLGYSLVERGDKLDEALAMIEQAVAGDPDNGAIVDSLGWVQFKMGNYKEAVRHLERATELEPSDPVVNDHLGDAYWAVGRHAEAQFQWQRALSFDPTEKESKRIRQKLAEGLDAVLDEEGKTLKVAERR